MTKNFMGCGDLQTVHGETESETWFSPNDSFESEEEDQDEPEAPIAYHTPSPLLIEVAGTEESAESIMARVANGEQSALEALMNRYSRLITSVIFGVVHDEAEAKEVMTEVFLHCWQNIAHYSPEKGKPLGWLVTMAKRKGIDRLRKRQRYCAATERLHVEVKHDAAAWMPHQHGDGNIERADLQGFVKAGVAELPAFQRAAIEYAYFSGLTLREIAIQTGTPLGTIKTRVELGLKKLSVSLKAASTRI